MNITGWTLEVEQFLKEWESPSPIVSVHTSGSTGRPKEIHLLKSDMIASACATNKFFGVSSASKLLMPLSASYIAGKMMVVRALMAECELIVEKPTLSPFIADVGRVSLMPVVPAQIRGMLERPWVSPYSIEYLIVGGGPVALSDEKLLLELGYNAYATYGMTETCSHVALRRFGTEEFIALPSIKFSVDSENCLVIHADDSYSWQKITTNDIVSLTSDCSFIWRGRRDFVINSGGLKIHPEEEEKRLREAGMAGEFYLTATANDLWGSAVTLVIEGEETESGAMMELCRKALSRYACPKRIIYERHFDRTSSGKIIRKKF